MIDSHFRSRRFTWHRAIATMTLVIVIAVVAVALIAGLAYVVTTSKHVNSGPSSTVITTTVTTAMSGHATTVTDTETFALGNGFPGYPSVLPTGQITTGGSTLMYVLFLEWLKNWVSAYPNVQLNPDAGGSGLGQTEIESKLVTIGDSDAYLSPEIHAQYPGILEIPLAISAQQINYNLPGFPQSIHLNFTGPILTQIYNGSITYWDDPQIKAINPAAANLLPHQVIIPLERADSSGDTFIFTTYLSDTDAWWNRTVGYGLNVDFPSIPTAEGESGNQGMVVGLQQYQYSIGYVGVSYLDPTISGKLGYGYLQNRAGNFVNISESNILSDVNAFSGQVPTNEVISLIDGPGQNSYPIVNFEYALVWQNQPSPNVAQDLKTFLQWAIDPKQGNSEYYMAPINFVALPSAIQQLSTAQINEITSS